MRFLLAILAGVALWGCSGGSGSDNQSATGSDNKPAASSDFKVALLTPGPTSDAGWSAMAYDGLKAIETELGAQVNNQQEVSDPQKIRDAMRTYAQEGYSLVFGHGYEYNEPAIEIAKDFPKTVFVSSSGSQTSANVGAFRFYLEQGFYLAGMTAALMSKTGTIAMIGGDNVPSIKSTFNAFRAGALAARPNIVVKEVFTGNGQDVAKARLATLNVIGEGADVVIHQANQAAQGVFNACKEKGVLAFGANLDQNSNESGVVLASAIIVGKPAFVKLAKSVKDGSFKGEVVLMGMGDGAIDFVWNPALESKVPADVKSKIEEAKKKLLDGSLVAPKDEF